MRQTALTVFLYVVLSATTCTANTIIRASVPDSVDPCIHRETGDASCPQLSGQPDATGAWVFSINIGEELVTPLLIDLSGPLPHAHSFTKMKLEIPVNKKFETFNLTLYPAKVVGNAREVKNMYATPVAKIPPNELQIFFQKAWGVATNRMGRLNDDWSCLHDYDVQAVFVFLQAYRELSRKLNMIPNTSIYPYTSWMKAALTHKQSRVDHAVGAAHARRAIEESQYADADRYKYVWRYIREIKSIKKRHKSLIEFHARVKSMAAKNTNPAEFYSHLGIHEGHILSGIAHTLATLIRCEEMPETELTEIEKYKTLINNMRQGEELSPELKEQLDSDVYTLLNLARSINNNEQRICNDAGNL